MVVGGVTLCLGRRSLTGGLLLTYVTTLLVKFPL